jgi:RNA polymerase sigma-70 factor (ECF subfamily)
LQSGGRAQVIHSLYSDHHGWLYRFLQRKLGDACDAADLAHDAFLRLLARPCEFDSDEGARAYLSTIARGLCIDLWRRRAIERAYLEALAGQAEATHPSAEHRAIVLETLFQIDAMVRRLPEKVREAFLLYRLHGMAYKDIAAELGVSTRMIKRYMAQAMLHCLLLQAGALEPAGK